LKKWPASLSQFRSRYRGVGCAGRGADRPGGDDGQDRAH
jgi:hypothetical protein